MRFSLLRLGLFTLDKITRNVYNGAVVVLTRFIDKQQI